MVLLGYEEMAAVKERRESFPLNMATIDHMDSRLSGNRQHHVDGSIRTRLVCRKRNEDLGRQEQKDLPREELWRRSGKYPLDVSLDA